MTLHALLLLCFASVAFIHGDYPPRIIVPRNVTFANKAWGFENGGKVASYTGRGVLIFDLDELTAGEVTTLKNANHIIQCYFSSGTTESWRDDYLSNQAAWDSAALAKLPNWDERWLDLRNLTKLKALLTPRFDRAKTIGCDALELDNVDCFDNAECYQSMGKTRAVAKEMQIEWNTWQVEAAHTRGLSISLKNALELVIPMANLYDFAVNEGCGAYSECGMYEPFLTQDKAVLNHEYSLNSITCNTQIANNIRSIRCAGSNGLCASNVNWVGE